MFPFSSPPSIESYLRYDRMLSYVSWCCRYGIALLKKRYYWVIAGVLAAYWARELLSMALCLSYVSPRSAMMIRISLIYHIAKVKNKSQPTSARYK